ncbi:hypothetical protein AAY85_28200, partial [Pseudomonas amygdali pv. lachrymans]
RSVAFVETAAWMYSWLDLALGDGNFWDSGLQPQMHDAGLQRRGRKNRSQSLRYSFEAIRDGDQNILNATSLEVVVPGIVDVSELAHCIGILKLLYIEVCRLDSSEAATVGT